MGSPNTQPRGVRIIVKPVESPSTIKEPVDAEDGKEKLTYHLSSNL